MPRWITWKWRSSNEWLESAIVLNWPDSPIRILRVKNGNGHVTIGHVQHGVYTGNRRRIIGHTVFKHLLAGQFSPGVSLTSPIKCSGLRLKSWFEIFQLFHF